VGAAKVLIGIDWGGTKIEGVAMETDGRERVRVRRDTPREDYAGCIAAIREMVPDELAASDARIAHLRERWFQGAPSKIVYAFERGTVACTLITRVLTAPSLRTHAYLDQAGSEYQTRAVRSVLIDHGLLPPRDELLARFELWLDSALAEIPDPGEQRTVTQYARWRHLRALRRNTMPSRSGQLSWRRLEIAGIIELLEWIHTRGGSLVSLTQADVDEWLTGGRRPFLHHFLTWTARAGASRPLTAPRPPSGALSPQAMSDEERWRLLADVTSDPSINPHTKLAAGLMLMFGVRAAKIVQLRAEDVTVTDAARGGDHLTLALLDHRVHVGTEARDARVAAVFEDRAFVFVAHLMLHGERVEPHRAKFVHRKEFAAEADALLAKQRVAARGEAEHDERCDHDGR